MIFLLVKKDWLILKKVSMWECTSLLSFSF